MSPRRPLLAGLLAAALVAVASPALAMTPMDMTPRLVIPGWSPSDPPLQRAAFDAQMSAVLYAVSCRGVTATGWASSMPDDTTYDWRSLLVTISGVGAACSRSRDDFIVRQGSETFPAYPWIVESATGVGSVAVIPYRPGAYWDGTPSPRIDQWVGIGGRAPDGSMLPILERRVVAVGPASFTVDEPVGSDYLGAPVTDNKLRILGSLTRVGAEITGAPVYCIDLFLCADADNVWRGITAPSEATDVKAKAGKGRITVTWKPAVSDGGDTVTYSYRVGTGPWTKTSDFTVTVKARKGQRVAVSVGTVNHAGAGPTVVVSAKAK